MNILRRFFRKDSNVLPLTVINKVGRPQRPDRPGYIELSKEGYAKNVIAFRCVNLIAGAVSRLPLCLYQRTKDGAQEIDDHPVLQLFRNPSPMITRTELLYSFVAYNLIKGDGFLEVVTNGKAPVFLYSHRPDRFVIMPGSNGMPSAYVVEVGGVKREFPVSVVGKSSIIHRKRFNPLSDWYGMSPLEAASYEIDQINEANNWNYALLKNSAQPSGVLQLTPSQYSTGVMSAEQRAELKRMLDEQFTGSKNNGRPMVLEGGLEWKAAAWSHKEMDFLENKKVSKGDVALVFGVPSQLVGISDSQTFANYEQANLSFYTDTVLPEADSVCEILNHRLLPLYPGAERMYFAVDRDQVDALAPMREKLWERAKSSFLTPNEARELVGYGRYDGDNTAEPADRLYITSSLTPIEMAAEPAAEPVDTEGDDGDLANEDDPADDKPEEEDPAEDETEEDA
jgi:HK97 family phage portal protein